MKTLLIIFLLHLAVSAQNYLDITSEVKDFIKEHPDTDDPSVSKGTVGNGSLVNGRLIPYKGRNFIYFNKDSYVGGRAFVHEKVKTTVVGMYDSLYHLMPMRYFTIMECSNEEGGRMFPHHTHQNGLSIDFMTPLLKNGKPYYELDTLGLDHYLLDFTDDGEYTEDKEVKVDFDLMARQILIMDHLARKVGMKVKKVLLKIELKDEFYASEHGQKVKEKGIYLAQSLTPLINGLHDDHFHVDFSFL